MVLCGRARSRALAATAAGLVRAAEHAYVGTMRGSLVCAWVGSALLFAGCTSPPEGATQQPSDGKKDAANADAKTDAKGEALCSPGAPGDGWQACDGKRVRLEGRAPQMIMQHPMMDFGPPGQERHQSYLDVEGGAQVIVISEAKNTCEGAMIVTGTLRSIDLGGQPGTKESYRGWQVSDAVVECR